MRTGKNSSPIFLLSFVCFLPPQNTAFSLVYLIWRHILHIYQFNQEINSTHAHKNNSPSFPTSQFGNHLQFIMQSTILKTSLDPKIQITTMYAYSFHCRKQIGKALNNSILIVLENNMNLPFEKAFFFFFFLRSKIEVSSSFSFSFSLFW